MSRHISSNWASLEMAGGDGERAAAAKESLESALWIVFRVVLRLDFLREPDYPVNPQIDNWKFDFDEREEVDRHLMLRCDHYLGDVGSNPFSTHDLASRV